MRFTTIFAAVLCAFASTTFALPTSVPANGVSSVVRPANLTHVVIERETAFGQPIQAKRDCGIVCQTLGKLFPNIHKKRDCGFVCTELGKLFPNIAHDRKREVANEKRECGWFCQELGKLFPNVAHKRAPAPVVPFEGVPEVIAPGESVNRKRDCGVVCQFLQDHFGNVIH